MMKKSTLVLVYFFMFIFFTVNANFIVEKINVQSFRDHIELGIKEPLEQTKN